MKKIHDGFTLIEVLIALAILSIALTAVIKVTSENIKNTIYLQNKTMAAWVALEVLNEVKANLLKLPAAPDEISNETNMLGRVWPWQAQLIQTPNANIQEIQVNVYEKSSNHLLITLSGYHYGT